MPEDRVVTDPGRAAAIAAADDFCDDSSSSIDWEKREIKPRKEAGPALRDYRPQRGPLPCNDVFVESYQVEIKTYITPGRGTTGQDVLHNRTSGDCFKSWESAVSARFSSVRMGSGSWEGAGRGTSVMLINQGCRVRWQAAFP